MATPWHSLRHFFDRPLPTGACAGWLALAAALTGLGGCSAYETVTEVLSNPVVLACPAHRVVADAQQLIQFRPGPGRDLVDVDFDGKIVDIRLECTSRVDKKTREGTQDVAVILVIEARRGPANRTRKAVFPYFVSVVGEEREIFYREAFTVSIDFPDNLSLVRFRSQPVVLELPINNRWTNRSYTIFTGFKLTQDQLEFNRKQASGTAK